MSFIKDTASRAGSALKTGSITTLKATTRKMRGKHADLWLGPIIIFGGFLYLLNPINTPSVNSDITVENKPAAKISLDDSFKQENDEYQLLIQPFYYNPIRGGVNCNDDCRYTRAQVRILEDDYKTPVGSMWWDSEINEGGAACPIEFLGNSLEALLPNGEKATFHCFDTGGDIVMNYENDQTLLKIDVLFEDGYGPNDGKVWNHPVTNKGYKLTDDLRLEARVIAQP